MENTSLSHPGEASLMPVLPEQSDELDDIEKQRARDELKDAKRYRGYTMLCNFNPTLHKHRTCIELMLSVSRFVPGRSTWLCGCGTRVRHSLNTV